MAIGYQSSAPRNPLQQNMTKLNMEVGQPSDEADRISYGIISQVDQDTSQVKVKELVADGEIGEDISPGFLPITTPLSEVHLLWGALREGLVVRIYWKGKTSPEISMVEVIGDEEHRFLSKVCVNNEVIVGPYKMFS